MEVARPCPCCGYLTLEDDGPGSYEICSVCFWEDDPVQLENPEMSGGANKVSLAQGRRNFAAFGACETEMLSHVRPPRHDEQPATDW